MDFFTALIALVVTLVLVGGSVFYMYAFQIQSKPDEWMLVIRNGKVVH